MQPPLPSIAASITNLKCMEEPLSTTTSVDSGEGPEMLPMAHTQSSRECPDVPKANDSNINHELDSVVCCANPRLYLHVYRSYVHQ